jgi:uncharacterized membrane protein
MLVFRMSFWEVFLIALLGSSLSIVFLLLFLKPISVFLSKKSKFFKKIFNWIFDKTRKKISAKIKRYKEWGIFIISSIPFPLFGVWTGALGAFLFDIPFKIAFPLIAFGNLIAISIVSVLTISGIAVEEIFGWKVLILIIGIIFILFLFYKLLKHKN